MRVVDHKFRTVSELEVSNDYANTSNEVINLDNLKRVLSERVVCTVIDDGEQYQVLVYGMGLVRIPYGTLVKDIHKYI